MSAIYRNIAKRTQSKTFPPVHQTSVDLLSVSRKERSKDSKPRLLYQEATVMSGTVLFDTLGTRRKLAVDHLEMDPYLLLVVEQ